MKKLVAIVSLALALLMLPIMVGAEGFDLSGLSYEELVALKDQINLAMWESDEWQEVRVPQGVYQVGVDIPAGHWTIKPAEGKHGGVDWGGTLDESNLKVKFGSAFYYGYLCSPASDEFDPDLMQASIDYDVKDGQYLVISGCTMIFTPYEGKPDLGFKK